MLHDKKKIEAWLQSMNIQNYIINEDLTIDVNGNVNIEQKNLHQIPVQFNIVKGNFSCNANKLTSLKGAPIEVYGDFDCYHNNLENLLYLPKIITGIFEYFSNPNIDLPEDLTVKEVHSYYSYKNLNEKLPMKENNQINKPLKI